MEIALYVLVAACVAAAVYWVWRAAKADSATEAYKAQTEAQSEKIDSLQAEVLEAVQKDNQETHEAVKDALARGDSKQLGFLLRKVGRNDPS